MEGKYYINSQYLQGRGGWETLLPIFSVLLFSLSESGCFFAASRTTRPEAATAMKFQALFFLLLLTCMYLSLAQGEFNRSDLIHTRTLMLK